ncbi:hypothetical protein GCM10027347_18620 [Larkinella harenae]
MLLPGCGDNENNKPDPEADICLISEVPDFYYDSGSATVQYNTENRVSAITMSSFSLFSFTYDATGKITKFSAGTSQAENLGAEEHTVTYDERGRLVRIQAGATGQIVTATPDFDDQNRLVKVTVTDPRGVRNYVKRMEYDGASNVSKVYYMANNQAERLLAEYKYDSQNSPFANQLAFQLIPLISSLTDKSHYLSVNNPIQYKDAGYSFTAVYRYTNELPTEASLLLQRTGNPGVTNKQKLFKYICR